MIEFKKENLKHIKTMAAASPERMQAFDAMSRAVFEGGVLDRKTTELMALAVSISKECPYCIEYHQKAARRADATDAEITEAAFVAAIIGAGAAVSHATHAFD